MSAHANCRRPFWVLGFVFFLATVVALASALVYSERSPSPFTNLDERELATERGRPETLPELPWHLASVYWELSDQVSVQVASVDFWISGDFPRSGNTFIVPIDAHLNGNQFYVGCITSIPDAVDERGALHHDIGPGVVFSRWGDTREDSIRPNATGYRFISEHEGPHVRVMIPYSWTKGRYRIRLCADNKKEGQLKEGTWVQAFIDELDLGKTTLIGAIRFPGRELILGRHPGCFVEVLDRNPWKYPVHIPNLTVGIGNLSLNDELTRPINVKVTYEPVHPRYAKVRVVDHEMPSGLPTGAPASLGSVLIHIAESL